MPRFCGARAAVPWACSGSKDTRRLHFYRFDSWPGVVVPAAIFVVALAVIVPFSVWQGWSWRAALVYAPASGISQELFFRAALLPALQMVLQRRAGLALLLHAVLFGLWHIGPLFVGAPIWAVIAVMLITRLVREEAQERGLRLCEVNGSQTLEEMVAVVEYHCSAVAGGTARFGARFWDEGG